MRYTFNPSLLNLGQLNKHVTKTALIVKVLVDKRVSLAKSIMNETNKTVAKVLIIVEISD